MRERTDDAGVHAPDHHLVPCGLCGSRELPEALEPAPECCARERRVCVECLQRIEDEERDEHAAEHFDGRQFVDARSLGLR
jgi:hypothetical protein